VLFLLGGVLLIIAAVAGLFFVFTGRPQATGGAGVGPRLQVDTERIDFGTQPFDKMVTASFQIQNVGDQVLTLDASAPVQVLEGC
jgi:hypothetical protein